jgi:hypothetical protein
MMTGGMAFLVRKAPKYSNVMQPQFLRVQPVAYILNITGALKTFYKPFNSALMVRWKILKLKNKLIVNQKLCLLMVVPQFAV